jgi:hypothetical protein
MASAWAMPSSEKPLKPWCVINASAASTMRSAAGLNGV